MWQFPRQMSTFEKRIIPWFSWLESEEVYQVFWNVSLCTDDILNTLKFRRDQSWISRPYPRREPLEDIITELIKEWRVIENRWKPRELLHRFCDSVSHNTREILKSKSKSCFYYNDQISLYKRDPSGTRIVVGSSLSLWTHQFAFA